jgi:hypothetical protein
VVEAQQPDLGGVVTAAESLEPAAVDVLHMFDHRHPVRYGAFNLFRTLSRAASAVLSHETMTAVRAQSVPAGTHLRLENGPQIARHDAPVAGP